MTEPRIPGQHKSKSSVKKASLGTERMPMYGGKACLLPCKAVCSEGEFPTQKPDQVVQQPRFLDLKPSRDAAGFSSGLESPLFCCCCDPGSAEHSLLVGFALA